MRPSVSWAVEYNYWPTLSFYLPPLPWNPRQLSAAHVSIVCLPCSNGTKIQHELPSPQQWWWTLNHFYDSETAKTDSKYWRWMLMGKHSNRGKDRRQCFCLIFRCTITHSLYPSSNDIGMCTLIAEPNGSTSVSKRQRKKLYFHSLCCFSPLVCSKGDKAWWEMWCNHHEKFRKFVRRHFRFMFTQLGWWWW